MNIKDLALYIIVLMGIQMLLVAIITRMNKEFFDDENALKYFIALRRFWAAKPTSAAIIMFCYAACFIELFIVFWVASSQSAVR